MCRHLARYYMQTHITKFGTGEGGKREGEGERERAKERGKKGESKCNEKKEYVL